MAYRYLPDLSLVIGVLLTFAFHLTIKRQFGDFSNYAVIHLFVTQFQHFHLLSMTEFNGSTMLDQCLGIFHGC